MLKEKVALVINESKEPIAEILISNHLMLFYSKKQFP